MGYSYHFRSKPYQKDLGCCSVWVAHAYLGQTSMNGHGLLFSLGYSCHFWSKPYLKDMGCSSVWVAHAHLGQTSMNGHGLLFSLDYSFHFGSKGYWLLFSVGCSCPFGSKQYEKDIGCSSVQVAQAVWGQTITKRIWVALQCGLLMSKCTFV